MKKYGLIPMDFWNNEKLLALPAQTFKVAVYLLAGPHTNFVGCYKIPLNYISEDLHLKRKSVVKAVSQLAHISYLAYDRGSSYVHILGFRSSGVPQNAKLLSAATREVSQMADSVPFKRELWLQLQANKGERLNGDQTAIPMPIDRQPKNQEGNQEGNLNYNQNASASTNADAGIGTLAPLASVSSFQESSFPKTFLLPLKDQTGWAVDKDWIEQAQKKFPHLIVQERLKHYQQSVFLKYPERRWTRVITERKILEYLGRDDAEAEMATRPRRFVKQ